MVLILINQAYLTKQNFKFTFSNEKNIENININELTWRIFIPCRYDVPRHDAY